MPERSSDKENCGMITIIDYGMGNLRSVQKALERVGAEAVVTDDPNRVAEASKVVLPGVGAFEDAIAALRRLDLTDAIRSTIDADKPFLGICLGLQLLFDRSFENGEHEGLGVIPGEVVRFELPREYSVPHMGWNEVRFKQRPPIFEGIDDGEHFYFVHSYYVAPREPSVIATTTDYHVDFCSSISRGRLFATQFHPEKSQTMGLKILRNFASL